ncbi:hypothetical protein DEH81_08690 [Pectobacterium zantedeschiae]|uniref:Uncharacterized protein n=1 Tax=Pectobacterium zantedeschiae TaxID=2034769 RepID=A0A9X8JLI0_9GAMM|nr:hypothetical protein CLR69_05790 [Pectobacterium zantedeschiae]RYC48396.1 hypothetical protein DEH81_08690 [Pectobacterium zantedeschiae]RYC49695.1 hypothetical protein CTN06_01590 [Pectobacterium zantedeschiae]
MRPTVMIEECRFTKTIVKTDNYKQKSLPEGGLSATFRFFSYAQSPLSSGAKVKKETENSSVHTCVTLMK